MQRTERNSYNAGMRNSDKIGFPLHRPRRLRQSGWIRDLVAETRLAPQDFIWPVFVIEGENTAEPVSSMPGVSRYTIDRLVAEARAAQQSGIPALALFPVVDAARKTADGKEALNADNLICRALSAVKEAVPEIGLIADVALDPYTSHGHDGLMSEKGAILNDETIEVLCGQALVQARAGADIIAPSDMMDGRVGAIRHMLEDEGLQNTMILSYTAKYASGYYGPFRDAVTSAGALKGDKKTYQMDPRNRDEALLEAALDISEGADMLMVKPGLAYLDTIVRLYDNTQLPLFAYHVSGEYSMLKAAAQNGWLDYDSCLMETLTAFKRAGCRGILTYAAREAVDLL